MSLVSMHAVTVTHASYPYVTVIPLFSFPPSLSVKRVNKRTLWAKDKHIKMSQNVAGEQLECAQ